ncbi:MAG: class I SAM-dependent methyltransferase, partial [Flavobacteriia bacterium]|nr:class I SAM-dependent methyltransferase [Flavobacteriia bacterium]
MKSNDEVIGFYDAFVEQQGVTGINDRIFGVYERM